MAIYKPKELFSFLSEMGIHPKKGLSQNFLVDGNILRKIIKTADVLPGDLVLEIGPGPGSLTEELLAAGAHVIAVEKDAALASALKRFKTKENNLDIFTADIMDFPIDAVLKQILKPGQKAKIIANLPYHLTSPILIELIPKTDLISSIVVMVQKEVAERLTALPGSHHYSSMTVLLNFYSHPEYAFTVSRQCFYPKPKVESAVIILNLKPPPYISNPERFFILTRTAFGQRRKMMRSSLRSIYSPEAVMKCLEEIGCNPQIRPEELSLTQFMELFEKLNPDSEEF